RPGDKGFAARSPDSAGSAALGCCTSPARGSGDRAALRSILAAICAVPGVASLLGDAAPVGVSADRCSRSSALLVEAAASSRDDSAPVLKSAGGAAASTGGAVRVSLSGGAAGG